jgi:glycosyltransferase involved in cell wall biosynthesis
MLVSIITPLYNASNWLEATVNSVLSQTVKDWEMIIVDDCSSDNSYELACKLSEQDKRIKVFQLKKNAGAAAARNKAISEAKGRYIAFLDSDDLWFPQKLEVQLNFMKDKDIAFSYSGYEKIDENGAVFDVVSVPNKLSYKDLLKTNYIGCLTAIYDTQKIKKVLMPINTKREDFATWLLILKKIDYAHSCNTTLAQYRVYAYQSSASKMKMAKENWYLYRNIEQLSLLSSCYYFFHYSIRGILRTKAPFLARVFGF